MMALSLRPPAVAGLFYPAEAEALQAEVGGLLAQAAPPAIATAPKAMIAPHAGYAYSGLTAAKAFCRLAPVREVIRRVVLIGPSHRVAFRGAALPAAHRFATPLGELAVDTDAREWLARQMDVIIDATPHTQEHSLEVLLPFLQAALADFTIVPLVLGAIAPPNVAVWLDHLWGGGETLLVVSSDLSHYNTYPAAQEMDQHTIDEILALHPQIAPTQACGATGINALLIAAQAHACRAECFDLRNSGDSCGDHSRVVGYAAIGFFPKPSHTAQGLQEGGRT